MSTDTDIDDLLDELRDEFLTDARERLETVEAALFGDADSADNAVTVIRRETHSIKGLAGTFGFPVVGLLAHRLEDYLSQLTALDDDRRADVDVFVRHMQEILQRGYNPDEHDAAALIRNLPVASQGKAAVPVEVLLVCPSRATTRIALHDLHRLGCRVATTRSAAQAIELAAQTRPDLLITSAVLGGIDGIDLVRALAAMRATAALPVAVLTSFADNHPALRALPGNVPLLHLDHDFGRRVGDLVAGLAAA